MQNAKIKSIASYEDWVKMLNRNLKNSDPAKFKPRQPQRKQELRSKRPERKERYTMSEMWFG